VKKGKTS